MSRTNLNNNVYATKVRISKYIQQYTQIITQSYNTERGTMRGSNPHITHTQTKFGGNSSMDTTTQQIIIITLGIIAIGSIIMGNQTILDIIVAGLIGFLGQKTMTDKQNETLTKQLIGDEEEDVQ